MARLLKSVYEAQMAPTFRVSTRYDERLQGDQYFVEVLERSEWVAWGREWLTADDAASAYLATLRAPATGSGTAN